MPLQVSSAISLTHLCGSEIPFFPQKQKTYFFAPVVIVSALDGKDVYDERHKRTCHLPYGEEIIMLDDEDVFEMKGYVFNPGRTDAAGNPEPGYWCSMHHHDLISACDNHVRLMRTRVSSAIHVNCKVQFLPADEFDLIIDFLGYE